MLEDPAVGHIDRGFRDAIHIDYFGGIVAMAIKPGNETMKGQGLPGQHYILECQFFPGNLGQGVFMELQLAEGRRGLADMGDFLVDEELIKVFRRSAHLIGHHPHAPAIEKGPPHFPDREVKGIGVKDGPSRVAVEMEPVVRRRKESYHVPMGNGHAFGLSSGTGSEHDIVQAVAGGDVFQVLGTAVVPRAEGGIQHHEGHIILIDESIGLGGLENDHLALGDFDNHPHPLGGIEGVHGHKGGPGLEHGEDSDDRIDTAVEAEPHQILMANAEFAEVGRQLIGPIIEHQIAKSFPGTGQCGGMGGQVHLMLEPCMQTAIVRCTTCHCSLLVFVRLRDIPPLTASSPPVVYPHAIPKVEWIMFGGGFSYYVPLETCGGDPFAMGWRTKIDRSVGSKLLLINGEEDEGMDSIYWPLIDVIRGGARLDSIAAKKKTVNFTDFKHGKQSEGPKIFREFGLRPFRCPNFDVDTGIKRGYDSGGSVHGPEGVITMREILEEATPVLSRLDPGQEGFGELDESKFFREVLDRTIEKNRGLLVAVDT